jgi:anti-sigma B factor antagonist
MGLAGQSVFRPIAKFPASLTICQPVRPNLSTGLEKESGMDIVCEHIGETLVARVREARIDAAIAIRFKDRMREVLADPAPRVVLDLACVDFLDSSGLGAVVAVMKMAGADRKVELAALTPTVEKVFRLTRMDRVFTIHPAAPTDMQHVD